MIKFDPFLPELEQFLVSREARDSRTRFFFSPICRPTLNNVSADFTSDWDTKKGLAQAKMGQI